MVATATTTSNLHGAPPDSLMPLRPGNSYIGYSGPYIGVANSTSTGLASVGCIPGTTIPFPTGVNCFAALAQGARQRGARNGALDRVDHHADRRERDAMLRGCTCYHVGLHIDGKRPGFLVQR